MNGNASVLSKLIAELNALEGKAPDREIVRVRSFFVYPVPVVTLAPGANGESSVQIDAATDFYWIKTVYLADDDAATGQQTDATRIIPSVDVQFQSSGSDKNLLNGFTPLPSVAGEGDDAFVLPFPMKLLANSQFRVDFVSRESARTLQLRLALVGWKDYGEMYADAS